MPYQYQITSTSAKFASLERKFYDLSENVYMSIVSGKILLGFEVFKKTPIFSLNAVAHRVQKGDTGLGTQGVKDGGQTAEVQLLVFISAICLHGIKCE